MIGLDTNVILRFLLQDDPVWSPVATTLFETRLSAEKPGYINIITLVELAWSLRRHPHYDRRKLFAVIMGLVNSDSLIVEDDKAVRTAAHRFLGGSAGFVDYLIAERNASMGAETTLTIDRKAAKTEPFELLSEAIAKWE